MFPPGEVSNMKPKSMWTSLPTLHYRNTWCYFQEIAQINNIVQRELGSILIKKKISVVSVFGLEQKTSHSITGTADEEVLSCCFKGG